MWPKKCIICEKDFKAKHPAEMMCSKECRKERKRQKNQKYLESKKKNDNSD